MWLIEKISPVNVNAVAGWIAAIPLTDWPQQSAHVLKPAMVTDIGWHDFGNVVRPIVENLSISLTGVPDKTFQWMLSAVMPGDEIDPHKDQQADYWKFRVHVPLLTNPLAVTIMDDGEYHMEVGWAYKMNVRETHAVRNRGDTPRVHFMFDVRN